MNNLDNRMRKAVQHFWLTRAGQARKQGVATGHRDHGTRTAVTGGKQMDGFVTLIRDLLIEHGSPEPAIFSNKRIELPGYFRAEKKWDLLIVLDGHLIAGIEFKSQVGSFGNNYNNRAEESIGSATDLWAAYREGAFKPSARPWLGYLMLLEETKGSTTPVAVREPHFNVFAEFKEASYAKRYEILLTKLLRDRLYDGACLLLAQQSDSQKGLYSEPCEELSFRHFASSLLAKAIASRTTG